MLHLQDTVLKILDPRTRPSQAIARVLDEVRAHMGVDVAFSSEFEPTGTGWSRTRSSNGHVLAPDMEVGSRRVFGGLPPAGDGDAMYVGVPVQYNNGAVYGLLSCQRRGVGFNEHEMRFLRVLSRLLAGHIEMRATDNGHHEGIPDHLQRVMDGSELAMSFQPIVDLASGLAVGFESLARFPAPPPRSPDAWFAEADVVGLRPSLEIMAVREAVARFDEFPDGAFMTINASPDVVVDERFAEAVAAVPGDRLVVEITEHARVDNYDALDAALGGLRATGTRLAIDDAGAGFASLRHILKLQPDIIKLDASLTQGVAGDGLRRALAGSLVAAAAVIDSMVVGEGIENRGDADALVELGVTTGQGYLLGRPQSALPR
jgi:EAL domain-containing protein (putative c-di-GMP-specific phosphodiesterase class I)